MNLLELLGVSFLQNRLVIPGSDLAAVAADASKYADGATFTPEQVAAIDRAIIDYVLGRIARQALPHGVGEGVQQVLTPGVGAPATPGLPAGNMS